VPPVPGRPPEPRKPPEPVPSAPPDPCGPPVPGVPPRPETPPVGLTPPVATVPPTAAVPPAPTPPDVVVPPPEPPAGGAPGVDPAQAASESKRTNDNCQRGCAMVPLLCLSAGSRPAPRADLARTRAREFPRNAESLMFAGKRNPTSLTREEATSCRADRPLEKLPAQPPMEPLRVQARHGPTCQGPLLGFLRISWGLCGLPLRSGDFRC
jgi:hypothetical protein